MSVGEWDDFITSELKKARVREEMSR